MLTKTQDARVTLYTHAKLSRTGPNCQKQKITCRENRKKENRKREREREKNRQQRLEVTFVVTTLVLAPPELPLLDVLEDSQQPLHPTRRIFPSIYQCGFSTVYRTRIKFLLQKKRGVFYLFFFFFFFFTNGETRFFYSPDFERRKREGKKAADAIDRSKEKKKTR